jgi:hypothetical protein
MGNGISTRRSDAGYGFVIVEETLKTETIAEYRRSRMPRRRPRASRIRAILDLAKPRSR